MTLWIRVSVVASLSIFTVYHTALAQQSAAPVSAVAASSGDLDEIVVNGIKRGELILPTQVTSTSAYGLDLGVMDTPRNNTLLSKAQLDALNIQNPGGFSSALVFSTKEEPAALPFHLSTPSVEEEYFGLHHDLSPTVIARRLDGDILWQGTNNLQWAAVLRFHRAVEARLDRSP